MKNKKILVTGGDGRFAKVLSKCNRKLNLYFASKKECNILNNSSIDKIIKKVNPKIVFHCAGLSRPMSIHEKSIDLYLHVNGIDTSTSAGRAMFSMIGIFSQFEREIIRDRINAGLARAKSEGKKLGRPSSFNEGMARSVRLLREQGMSIKKIASNLEIGIGTVYKALDQAA